MGRLAQPPRMQESQQVVSHSSLNPYWTLLSFANVLAVLLLHHSRGLLLNRGGASTPPSERWRNSAIKPVEGCKNKYICKGLVNQICFRSGIHHALFCSATYKHESWRYIMKHFSKQWAGNPANIPMLLACPCKTIS